MGNAAHFMVKHLTHLCKTW